MEERTNRVRVQGDMVLSAPMKSALYRGDFAPPLSLFALLILGDPWEEHRARPHRRVRQVLSWKRILCVPCLQSPSLLRYAEAEPFPSCQAVQPAVISGILCPVFPFLQRLLPLVIDIRQPHFLASSAT